MYVVVLYLDPAIGRVLLEVLELEGYAVVVTRDAGEAMRAIEEGDGPALLLVDNFLLSPAAREAFGWLAGEAELRRRVRVIGLAAWDRPEESAGLIDDFIEMPFTVRTLLEAVEASVGRGSEE